jgi:hypothetical protein
MQLASHPRQVPLSTYFHPNRQLLPFANEDCDDSARNASGDSAVVRLVPQRLQMGRNRSLPKPWWCGEGKLCIFDWTPCGDRERKKQSASGERPEALACPRWSTTPRDLMGRVISEAFDFVERECSNSIELATPRGAGWYKSQPPFKVRGFANLSQGVMQATARLQRMGIQRVWRSRGIQNLEIARYSEDCGKSLEIAAMLRIAQEPWFRKPPEDIKRHCLTATSWLNAWSNKLIPRATQPCPHFLATDWFARADPGARPSHTQVMDRCISDMDRFAGINTSKWWHLNSLRRSSNHDLRLSVRGIPELESALAKDPSGLRSIIELAMLVRADECVEASHMAATIANLARRHLGKTACQHLHVP